MNIRKGAKRQSAKKKCICIAMAVLLTAAIPSACASKDSKPYGKETVLRYVAKEVTGESYTLVSIKQVEELPADFEYTFTSDDRDLTFTANSYIANVWVDGPTSLYYKEITCHYGSAVSDIYTEKIEEYQNDHPDIYTDGWTRAGTFSDIEDIASGVVLLSDILAQELEYNDREFISENLKRGVAIYSPASETVEDNGTKHFVNDNQYDLAEESGELQLCTVWLDGESTEDDFYREIAEAYAQAVADGKVKDPGDISIEYKEKMHVSSLDRIYLNGAEMTYDEVENPNEYYRLSTDDHKEGWYDFDFDSYMMVIDTGYYTEAGSYPLIIAEYVQALGGSWEFTGNPYKGERGLRWTIGENSWELECMDIDEAPYITELGVTKNGEKQELEFLTSTDTTKVGATYCAAITIDDFAELFELEYRIDETSASIYFTEKETL